MEKLSKRALAELREQRDKIQAHLQSYRELVRRVSEKLHHQACSIGGMQLGFGCDISGAPCWCGADDPERGWKVDHNLGVILGDHNGRSWIVICSTPVSIEHMGGVRHATRDAALEKLETIVREHNAHEALVDALRGVLRTAEIDLDDGQTALNALAVIRSGVRQALALVKEG